MQNPTHTLYRPLDFDDERAPATVVVEPGGVAESHWMTRGYTTTKPVAKAAKAGAKAKAQAKAKETNN